MLEGESVPHRDHHHPEAVGEPGGPRMPGVQVTHDEPAAMQPHDRARAPGAGGGRSRPPVRLGGHEAGTPKTPTRQTANGSLAEEAPLQAYLQCTAT